MSLSTADFVALRERLKVDTPLYAEFALKIVNPAQQLVPLKARAAQLRFDHELDTQAREGKPVRAIVLKARKLGFSTWVQAKMIQRSTLTANHKAVVVAHDMTTSGELFEIARIMYAHLPTDEALALKPELRYSRKSNLLSFGTSARRFQQSGDLGLNSSILVDTAGEVQSGRGFTYNSAHLSEIAFWPDSKRKLTSLLNTVPDEANTMVVLESTANGHNHFKTLWDRAVEGKSDWLPIFFAWFEHPDYTKPFISDQDRSRFEASLGDGEWGAGEIELMEQFDLTLEQMNWRRWAIENRCQSDLQIFHQEYPATPEEAFLSSGDRVFATGVLIRARQAARLSDPPQTGQIIAEKTRLQKGQHGIVEVPTNPLFVEGKGDWKIWVPPQEGGQYVLGVDVSGGERSDPTADPARHAIEVIDHVTREQCAEYVSRVDEDLLARIIHLAALLYNQAWAAIEITGGWGGPIARMLWQDFRYPLTYTRPTMDRLTERSMDRLGWDTNTQTKPILEAGAKELLRGEHGIHSSQLVDEMFAYVKLNERGKTGPSPGSQSDRLMAWMIGQQVATEKPLRRIKRDGERSRRRSYYRPRTYGVPRGT